MELKKLPDSVLDGRGWVEGTVLKLISCLCTIAQDEDEGGNSSCRPLSCNDCLLYLFLGNETRENFIEWVFEVENMSVTKRIRGKVMPDYWSLRELMDVACKYARQSINEEEESPCADMECKDCLLFEKTSIDEFLKWTMVQKIIGEE